MNRDRALGGRQRALPGVVFSGEFDDSDNAPVLLMAATFLSQGCNAWAAWDMAEPITVPEGGAFGVSLSCGGSQCSAFWVGTYARL